jgi:TatD DNase family protein
MILADVHCHLDHEYFRDKLDEVIRRAEGAGVKAIVTSGVNPETNRISLELAKKYKIVRAALGVYPIDALKREIEEMKYPVRFGDTDVDSEIGFIEENKDRIAAIAEVGLDFLNSDERQKEEQEKVFRRFVELAKRIDKPLVVHSRKAEARVVEILEELKPKKVVLHCFSGRHHLVKQAIKNGWYLSIPCNIVRSEHFQKVVEFCPLAQLFTETDAPLLSPYKDRMNEPAFVAVTIQKIAEIKGMDAIEVANNLYLNYQRIFE